MVGENLSARATPVAAGAPPPRAVKAPMSSGGTDASVFPGDRVQASDRRRTRAQASLQEAAERRGEPAADARRAEPPAAARPRAAGADPAEDAEIARREKIGERAVRRLGAIEREQRPSRRLKSVAAELEDLAGVEKHERLAQAMGLAFAMIEKLRPRDAVVALEAFIPKIASCASTEASALYRKTLRKLRGLRMSRASGCAGPFSLIAKGVYVLPERKRSEALRRIVSEIGALQPAEERSEPLKAVVSMIPSLPESRRAECLQRSLDLVKALPSRTDEPLDAAASAVWTLPDAERERLRDRVARLAAALPLRRAQEIYRSLDAS